MLIAKKNHAYPHNNTLNAKSGGAHYSNNIDSKYGHNHISSVGGQQVALQSKSAKIQKVAINNKL